MKVLIHFGVALLDLSEEELTSLLEKVDINRGRCDKSLNKKIHEKLEIENAVCQDRAFDGFSLDIGGEVTGYSIEELNEMSGHIKKVLAFLDIKEEPTIYHTIV